MTNIVPLIRKLNKLSVSLWYDDGNIKGVKSNNRIFNWSIIRLNRKNIIIKLIHKYEGNCDT
jgi:hypothetical protein